MITRNDFKGVANISLHCNLDSLNIAINEAVNFDLEELFCDFFHSILAIHKEVEDGNTEPLKLNLINGGEFTTCNNQKRTHLGVKKIVAYYAYSRYIMLNGYEDTPSGTVTKTNDFSIPKPLKEVQQFADKYRTMGFLSFKKTLEFIKQNREHFNFTTADACACGKCNAQTQVKGFGFNSSIIKKK